MTSLHRGMFMLLTVGALGVPAGSAMAGERSPLFVDVPPTRTAPLAAPGPAPQAPAVAAAAQPAGPLAVEAARVQASATGRTVVVQLSREPKSQKYFTLENGARPLFR